MPGWRSDVGADNGSAMLQEATMQKRRGHWDRIDAGDGTRECPTDYERAERIIADCYSEPEDVISESIQAERPVRCNFASYEWHE